MDDAPDEPDDYFYSHPSESEDESDEDVDEANENSESCRPSSPAAIEAQDPSSSSDEATATTTTSPAYQAQSANNTANSFFRAGSPAQAEGLYTKALLMDPSAPTLYTNRAMARLQLKLWEGVLADCEASLAIKEVNMKARYYGAQALLQLGRPEKALEEAKKAYEVACSEGAGSLGSVVGVVLKCKKAVWEEKERVRLEGKEEVKEKVVQGLRRHLEQLLEEVEEGADIEKERIGSEWEKVIEEVETVWVEAGKAEKKREVPDWMIDEITFAIMIDPVSTKTGKSYERASILEHLRRSPTDPLTREPLRVDELRPNLALREACEAFIKENGWAVDY